MSETQVQQIVVKYDDVLENTLGTIKEIMVDGNDFTIFEEGLMRGLNHPIYFTSSLKDGNTPIYLAPHMEQVEKYVNDQTPFVLIVTKGEKVWATVNGDHLNY